jgi:hypothetical protein
MLAIPLLPATSASDVTSGAVLTLVLPLGITVIALCVWWYVATHNRATRPPSDAPTTEANGPAATAP